MNRHTAVSAYVPLYPSGQYPQVPPGYAIPVGQPFPESQPAPKEVESGCCLIPNNRKNILECSFALVTVCAIALAAVVLIGRDPSLSSLFVIVFSVAGAASFIAFVLGVVAMVRKCQQAPAASS